MLQARRTHLRPAVGDQFFHHPGLALQRYLEAHGDDHAAARQLLQRAENSKANQMYRLAFQRWKSILENRSHCHTRYGILEGALAIGLRNESPLEAGLALHHTYGMPIIPGSALKGLCRRAALRVQSEKKTRRRRSISRSFRQYQFRFLLCLLGRLVRPGICRG
jgi:CRISPR/Cas system CMR subunit Cmr6 (Cas7 group RAMP superfamily)